MPEHTQKHYSVYAKDGVRQMCVNLHQMLHATVTEVFLFFLPSKPSIVWWGSVPLPGASGVKNAKVHSSVSFNFTEKCPMESLIESIQAPERDDFHFDWLTKCIDIVLSSLCLILIQRGDIIC